MKIKNKTINSLLKKAIFLNKFKGNFNGIL